jgi:malate dehydrogenase (oxaloacetate-decarboxylating)(NADP+)
MQKDLRREQALEYHAKGRPGKIEVIPTKEAKTQRDLLAYSPGSRTHELCKPELVYKYTAKGTYCCYQLFDRTGIGNIGPKQKPVWKEKRLFKIFADIDVLILTNETDPDKFVGVSNRSNQPLVASTWRTSKHQNVSDRKSQSRNECR